MTDQSHAQIQRSIPTTTGVFALLKAKPGVTRERVMAIMPAEIRATVQLYLDGKICEWYSREDGRGGVFLLNTRDVAEAKSIMESLPLAKEDMLDHEYVPVGPLMPLRLLMGNQPAKQQTGDPASAAVHTGQIPSDQAWFAGGERVSYDPKARAIITAQDGPLKIFLRREGDVAHAVTFLPGFPDGSFGWAKVRPHLPDATEMPKLFVDYVGIGDSDKPKDYAYSTAERADLVEAIWRDLSVRSTTLVAFDFSSLVVLEHLQRRLERSKRGAPAGGPEIRGVFIFNGGLFTDGHSHPWYTTPMLRRLPNRARQRLAGSFPLFKMMTRVLWSKGYKVTDAEVRELYNTMNRHDGGFYTAAAAGFVADHKAQGERLDFGRLFEAYRDVFPFLVGGSDEDPFEHRQIDLAQKRLRKLGLQIARLPGGHLTTNEQPEALAALIAKFERGLAKIQPVSGSV